MAEALVLDHGYIKVIETWGSDERIVEAARMSTNKGFRGWGPSCSKCGIRVVRALDSISPADYERGEKQRACFHDADVSGDEKLLRYLYEHKHATPFEMAGAVIEVQAPIFVFREWHRHRTQSYNEMSARYTPMPNEHYMPDADRCLVVDAKNKQAGAVTDGLTHESVLEWLEELGFLYAQSEAVYQSGLKRGVPKELARLAVLVSRYTRMRASANLRNWMAFMTLRSAPDAQKEIRVYSDALGTFLEQKFPRTMALFLEERR